MGRNSYLGGHSVWYSDSARARNYRTGGGMNFGAGAWCGRYMPPKKLPKPRKGEAAGGESDALVQDYLRRCAERRARQK